MSWGEGGPGLLFCCQTLPVGSLMQDVPVPGSLSADAGSHFCCCGREGRAGPRLHKMYATYRGIRGLSLAQTLKRGAADTWGPGQIEVPNSGTGLNGGFCTTMASIRRMPPDNFWQRRILEDSVAEGSQTQRGKVVFPESHGLRTAFSL